MLELGLEGINLKLGIIRKALKKTGMMSGAL